MSVPSSAAAIGADNGLEERLADVRPDHGPGLDVRLDADGFHGGAAVVVDAGGAAAHVAEALEELRELQVAEAPVQVGLGAAPQDAGSAPTEDAEPALSMTESTWVYFMISTEFMTKCLD